MKGKKKLTGADHAKINKRKKFYEKLLRWKDEKQILISMNKSITFPEFDPVSKLFEENFTKFEEDLDYDKIRTLDIIYMEEAHFLLKAAKSKVLKIMRKETFIDDDGNDRKGISGADSNYNYQSAFNWVVALGKSKKLLEMLETEAEDPTEYDLTPTTAVIQEPIYRKSQKWKPKRRRK